MLRHHGNAQPIRHYPSRAMLAADGANTPSPSRQRALIHGRPVGDQPIGHSGHPIPRVGVARYRRQGRLVSLAGISLCSVNF